MADQFLTRIGGPSAAPPVRLSKPATGEKVAGHHRAGDFCSSRPAYRQPLGDNFRDVIIVIGAALLWRVNETEDQRFAETVDAQVSTLPECSDPKLAKVVVVFLVDTKTKHNAQATIWPDKLLLADSFDRVSSLKYLGTKVAWRIRRSKNAAQT